MSRAFLTSRVIIYLPFWAVLQTQGDPWPLCWSQPPVSENEGQGLWLQTATSEELLCLYNHRLSKEGRRKWRPFPKLESWGRATAKQSQDLNPGPWTPSRFFLMPEPQGEAGGPVTCLSLPSAALPQLPKFLGDGIRDSQASPPSQHRCPRALLNLFNLSFLIYKMDIIMVLTS